MNKIYEIKSSFNETFDNDCNIVLNIKDDCDIKYVFKNCNASVFVNIDLSKEAIINENVDIINSNVHFYYVDLNNLKFNFISNMNVYRDSDVYVDSILLASNLKNIKFNATNIEDHSNFEIHNNVIGLKDSDYSLEIIGNILKKSPYSKCIQKTHCLSIGEPINLKVLPVLNIDNENVIASHSLSSGTIDSNILYYLNSRGFTKEDALKLIVSSYLSLPGEVNDIFNFAGVNDSFDERVKDLCLM